jgi:hypothetical protein
VSVLDDWLGIVGNWAETEALKIVGGIVRLLSKAIDMSEQLNPLLVVRPVLLEEPHLQGHDVNPYDRHSGPV